MTHSYASVTLGGIPIRSCLSVNLSVCRFVTLLGIEFVINSSYNLRWLFFKLVDIMSYARDLLMEMKLFLIELVVMESFFFFFFFFFAKAGV